MALGPLHLLVKVSSVCSGELMLSNGVCHLGVDVGPRNVQALAGHGHLHIHLSLTHTPGSHGPHTHQAWPVTPSLNSHAI